jgi:hypothetical protein
MLDVTVGDSRGTGRSGIATVALGFAAGVGVGVAVGKAADWPCAADVATLGAPLGGSSQATKEGTAAVMSKSRRDGVWMRNIGFFVAQIGDPKYCAKLGPVHAGSLPFAGCRSAAG